MRLDFLSVNSGRAAYGASKAAQWCATRALSREVGTQGVRVKVIAPDITVFHMNGRITDAAIAEPVASTNMHRIAAPSDIDDVAVYLASDLSSEINSQALRVDGKM